MANTIVLRVPIQVKRVGGRVLVIAPPDSSTPQDDGLDRVALTAIATAFHWKEELESGKYRSQKQMAAAKGMDYTVMRRQLNLVFLAPFIIQQLLDGRQPSGFSIYKVMASFPLAWEEQCRLFGFLKPSHHQRHMMSD